MTAYQIAYTLPRWESLVGAHLRSGGTSPAAAVAALSVFAGVCVWHTVVQVLPSTWPTPALCCAVMTPDLTHPFPPRS